MLFWSIRASIPSIYHENKTVCVFFQGAFDGNVKISPNIVRKEKNSEILIFLKNRFFKDPFLASPAEPTDRPIGRPTDPNKIRGVWGGFAPPAIIFFFKFFKYFLYKK